MRLHVHLRGCVRDMFQVESDPAWIAAQKKKETDILHMKKDAGIHGTVAGAKLRRKCAARLKMFVQQQQRNVTHEPQQTRCSIT